MHTKIQKTAIARAHGLPTINRSGQLCTIRTPTPADAVQLSALISSDEKLRQTTQMNAHPAPGEYLAVIQDWRDNRQTLVLAIVITGDNAVGQIALSHIDFVQRQCQIGYWLGSEYWNQGIMTEAVDLALSLARELGLLEITATVDKTNIASLRILRKYYPKFESISENKYRCEILQHLTR